MSRRPFAESGFVPALSSLESRTLLSVAAIDDAFGANGTLRATSAVFVANEQFVLDGQRMTDRDGKPLTIRGISVPALIPSSGRGLFVVGSGNELTTGPRVVTLHSNSGARVGTITLAQNANIEAAHAMTVAGEARLMMLVSEFNASTGRVIYSVRCYNANGTQRFSRTLPTVTAANQRWTRRDFYVAPDQSIYVAFDVSIMTRTTVSADYDVSSRVYRVKPDGTLDTAFGKTGGALVIPMGKIDAVARGTVNGFYDGGISDIVADSTGVYVARWLMGATNGMVVSSKISIEKYRLSDGTILTESPDLDFGSIYQSQAGLEPGSRNLPQLSMTTTASGQLIVGMLSNGRLDVVEVQQAGNQLRIDDRYLSRGRPASFMTHLSPYDGGRLELIGNRNYVVTYDEAMRLGATESDAPALQNRATLTAGGQVLVTGTSAADRLKIRPGAAGKLLVDLNGTSFSFDVASVRGFRVYTGSGNDRVSMQIIDFPAYFSLGNGSDRFDASLGLPLNSAMEVVFGSCVVDGGSGNDNLRGGACNDVLRGDNGDDLIAGDRGDDLLVGGGGRDTLDALDGDNRPDQLIGGGDADTFGVARSRRGRHLDIVADLDESSDTLLL
jgi:hypothetical protein